MAPTILDVTSAFKVRRREMMGVGRLLPDVSVTFKIWDANVFQSLPVDFPLVIFGGIVEKRHILVTWLFLAVRELRKLSGLS